MPSIFRIPLKRNFVSLSFFCEIELYTTQIQSSELDKINRSFSIRRVGQMSSRDNWFEGDRPSRTHNIPFLITLFFYYYFPNVTFFQFLLFFSFVLFLFLFLSLWSKNFAPGNRRVTVINAINSFHPVCRQVDGTKINFSRRNHVHFWQVCLPSLAIFFSLSNFYFSFLFLFQPFCFKPWRMFSP